MIVDLSESPRTDLPEYDVCIVGSGPAGMTVANELAGAGLSLCVLESGRQKPTRHGDRLRRVQSEGILIKEYSRERVLGGASTTWAGLSSPLDAIDMKPRPALGRPGWPIAREELLSCWAEAAARYRFPPLESFAGGTLEEARQAGDLKPQWSRLEEKTFLAAVKPQSFGKEFRHVFEGKGADLYLDATVLRLCAGGERDRILWAEAVSSRGDALRLRARAFVLATGGIENARLLLCSTDLCARGLGNEHDQVGRCLMNHPKNNYGVIRLARPLSELPLYFGCLAGGFAGYAGLRLNEKEQEERGLLNPYVRLEPLYPWSDNRGVEAFILLAKRARFLARSLARLKGGKALPLRDYAETGDDSELQNARKSAREWIGLGFKVVLNLPLVCRYLWARLAPGAGPKIRAIRLRNFMEMEPDPENRVLLSEEQDACGQPVPVVRHCCTERDRRSLIALHEALAEEVQRNGLGELSSGLAEEPSWPIDLDASHHLGTTRMGRDPAHSAVDAECRLHAVRNVYLAGASVFPTSGSANPTFTIVALAIRLARSIARDLGASKAAGEAL